MFDFEKQFEDMEVVTMTMEGTMDSSTATSTPAEDVDALIQMVWANTRRARDRATERHAQQREGEGQRRRRL